jgi:hypothetical protein
MGDPCALTERRLTEDLLDQRALELVDENGELDAGAVEDNEVVHDRPLRDGEILVPKRERGIVDRDLGSVSEAASSHLAATRRPRCGCFRQIGAVRRRRVPRSMAGPSRAAWSPPP